MIFVVEIVLSPLFQHSLYEPKKSVICS